MIKYKNRKKARRKYKQALVTTVAAMTLSLSIGSSFSVNPTAVYAAESSSQGFKIINNTILIASNPDTQAVVSTLIGPSLVDLIKNGNVSNTNFENGLKNVAFGAIAMIPYGGTFVSSILSMLWPSEDNSAQRMVEEIMKQVDELIDQKLIDKDLVDLDSDIRGLQKALADYERSVNPYDGEDHSKETNKSRAVLVKSKFETMLEKCSKKGYEESELPLFTSVATAYLTFLEFLKINGEGPIFGMDKTTYASYVTNLSGFRNHTKTTNLQGLAEEYKQYIHDTGTSATDKLINKAKSIARRSSRIQPTQSFVDTRSVSGISAYLNDNFKELQRLNSIYNDKSPAAKVNDMMPATNAEVNKARQVLNDFNAVAEKLDIYNKTTLYNKAFYAVSEAISPVLTDTNMESQIKEKFAAMEPSIEDLKIIKDDIVSTKIAFSSAEQASKNLITTEIPTAILPLDSFTKKGDGSYESFGDEYILGTYDGSFQSGITAVLPKLEKNKKYKLVVNAKVQNPAASQGVKLDFANKQSKEFILNGENYQKLELAFTTDENLTGDNARINMLLKNSGMPLIINGVEVFDEGPSMNQLEEKTIIPEEKTISDANRVALNEFVSELGDYFKDHDCYGLTPASSPRYDGVYANIYKSLTNLEKNKQYKLAVKLRTFGSVAKVKLDFANKQSKEFTLNGDQMQTLELPFTTDNNPTGANGAIGISVMNQDAVLIQEVGVISL
ncbi:TPA: hypothetical protein ROY17_005353 [Bacillus thuringiensis]|nr:hypothetical protein [Bacillus thuringiensis]